ncbi:hypothetical protein OHB26_16485 [Nocardia sp. NBC_01503]|uniref:hypothetical protein n=1 Tax=Nocardia sp. NBC_01503 TaxID=2975997 RepID=UPI002E7B04D7|nr:hypothetical protein [Nocardia sp. NBC_01503]WTL35649.1 hypothetical protein OHB26_16485 [Nocardia sp. NBC_01503]
MAIPATSRIDRPPATAEPPLGVLGAAFAGVFVAGLVISTIRAGGSPFPSPFGNAGEALDYFRDHPAAVRTGALLQFASAIPLTLYTAAVAARLRRSADGFAPTLAAIGGTLAAAFLFCSGAVSWVLTLPAVTGDPALVRAMHTLAFLVGGPANVVSTGLLIAGIALGAQSQRRLAPWLFAVGLVIALIALCSTSALAFTAAAFLLPIARFTGMAWLITVGFLLSRP